MHYYFIITNTIYMVRQQQVVVILVGTSHSQQYTNTRTQGVISISA